MSSCLDSANNTVCTTYLTTGQAVGLAFNVETGLISAASVFILLCLVVRNVVRNIRYPPPESWSLLRTHVDVYFLTLMIFDFIHGVFAVLDAKWIHDGKVSCSTFCTVQGAGRNVGSTGIALTTLAIAIHTFLVIFFNWTPPRGPLVPLLVVTVFCTFILCFVILESTRNNEFYEPTPFWCWIGSQFTSARIIGQYGWLWLAAFVSLILYIPLYFRLRGNILVDPERWWRIRFRKLSSPIEVTKGELPPLPPSSDATAQALNMLMYPACYMILVLPLSLTRWIGYALEVQGKELPFALAIIGLAVYGLSGIVNVALFMLTRPNLLLFRQRQPARALGGGRWRGQMGAESSVVRACPDWELRLRRLHLDPAISAQRTVTVSDSSLQFTNDVEHTVDC